jgi:hypothetical protein
LICNHPGCALAADTFAFYSHDTGTHLLKRPLPDDLAANESKNKRQKSSEPVESVAQKIENEEYGALDDVLRDVKRAVRSRLDELLEDEDDDHTQANNEAISQALRFEAKAEEMFNRESSYPNDKDRWRQPVKSEFRDSLPSAALGHQVLTVWGMGSRAMPFFSSVPHPPGGGPAKPISEQGLPNGVTLTRIMTPPNSKERSSSHPLTLGELFPSPRNLPPLQPPKIAKTSTKGNVLKFYHPDASEKSRYRTNTYSSHDITAGHYLDYSNAAPSSQIKTRQRERAQSLAGHKPSSTELVNTETEALFRGAFSSFAPVRDDTGAIVSAGQAGRLWWNKVGHRALDRMIEAELPDDESDVATTAPITPVVESMALDDVLIKDTLNNWDDVAIDPSLQDVMPKKPAADKELDEVLDEVSDLIETLASFQWNRNLTLPTSQDRQSIDPINGDMLRNASSAHQPSEDETLTYKTLQSQLALIIQGLPPFAVARLNSDKLAELNVSMKIPVHMDEYSGAMEEDEANRARPQQPTVSQTVPTPAPRPVSRTPSMPGLQYTSQYGAQYSASRPPMPSPQGYAHTSGRPAQSSMYGSRPTSNVPVPMQYRPTPPGQSSRPAQPYSPGYGSQLARTPGAYGQNSMAGYPTGSPGQQQRPGYPQGSTPGSAYAANYRAGQPPARPAGGYPFANGAPIRNVSPQSGYHGASQQQAGNASYGAGSGAPQSQQRAQGTAA